MPTPDEIRRDLPPDLDRVERERLVALALRLQAGTPPPAPAFRGELRRRLLDSDRRRVRAVSRPRVRALALSYAASGLALLAIAAAGLAGAGPFAAG